MEAGMTDDAGPYVSPEGRLTDEGAQLALTWIGEKWLGSECPFHSQKTTWSINRTLGQFDGYRPSGSLAGYVFPAVVVTCQVCGFMVPVNAIKMGVVVPDNPPAPPIEEPQSPSEPSTIATDPAGE
jgi:hypothetical protein